MAAVSPLGQASSPGAGVVTLVFADLALDKLEAVLKKTEGDTPGLFFQRGRFEFQTFDGKPRLHLYFGKEPPPPLEAPSPRGKKRKRPALEPWRDLDLRGSEVEQAAANCNALSHLCADDSLNPAEGELSITANDECVTIKVAGYTTFTLDEARLAVSNANLCICAGGHVSLRTARVGRP